MQEPSEPHALVSFVRECDDTVTVRLSESVGHEPNGQVVKIDHAELRLKLRSDQYIFGCRDASGRQTATVAVTHREADWMEPFIFRAWKADLESWTFEEIFDGPAVCRTHPPMNCGRSN